MLAVIGNHGAEPSPFAKRAAREVAAWLPMLAQGVARLQDVVIENKVLSVSVHYWHVADPAVVVAAIEALVPTLPHRVTIVHGIGLVNLVPHGAPDKGGALKTLLVRHQLPGAIFVGDELTDESAFRHLADGAGLGVRVGRSRGTAATHHIDTQADIDALLTELLIGRTRPAARPSEISLASTPLPDQAAGETRELEA